MDDKKQREEVSKLRQQLQTDDALVRTCILKLQADTRLHYGMTPTDLKWVGNMADALRQWGSFTLKQKSVAVKLAHKYADLIVAAKAEEANGSRPVSRADLAVAVEGLADRPGWGEF